MAFDITAACSGFVVALVTAAQFIRTGLYRNVLVIGGDALSRFVDWRDRCAPRWCGVSRGCSRVCPQAWAATASGCCCCCAGKLTCQADPGCRCCWQHLVTSTPACWAGPCDQACRAALTCALPAATCILFGDGCGAVVLTAQPGQCCLLGSSMHSDGCGQKHLSVRPPAAPGCLRHAVQLRQGSSA